MSSERPEAEQNAGVFLNPSGSDGFGGLVVPMHPLNVGPGEPGPGDEWHLPPEPTTDAAAVSADTADVPTDPTDKR
jgi:hypothetical protein